MTESTALPSDAPQVDAIAGARPGSERPRIVEMFGPPGAGKSTLAKAAARKVDMTRPQLTAAWRQLARIRKGAFILHALLDLPCLWHAARFAFAARLATAESLMRLARLVAKTQWMRSQSGELLLDQSFLQEIWSICAAAGRTDPYSPDLSDFIRTLYAGTDAHIMFVDAPSLLASQRIRDRSHGFSRLDGLRAEDVEERLAGMARLPLAIVAAAAAAGLPVERLDAAAPVEANAQRLRYTLASRQNDERAR